MADKLPSLIREAISRFGIDTSLTFYLTADMSHDDLRRPRWRRQRTAGLAPIGLCSLLSSIGGLTMVGQRRIEKFLGLGVAVLGFMGSGTASAAAISGSLYEPFGYLPGTQFAGNPSTGQNGGAGWNLTGDFNSGNLATSQWGDATAGANGLSAGTAARKIATTGSLSFSAIGYPATGQGNKLNMNSPAPTVNESVNVGRALGGQTIDAGDTYFSFLVQKVANDTTIRTINLALFGGGAERLAMGQIGAVAGNTGGNFGMLFNNTNPGGLVTNTVSPIAMGTGITHLVIGKVTWNAAGFETVSMWVDPTNVTNEGAAGTPYLTSSAFELTSVNAIRPFTGNNAVIAGFEATPPEAAFDEIRFGGTWASVTTDAVPLPTPILTFAVDRGTGQITIRNPEAVNVNLKGYAIASVAGSLDSATWSSIADTGDSNSGNSFDPNSPWTETSTTSVLLAESANTGTGGQLLATTGSRSLGNAWVRSPFQDLAVSYTLGDGRTGSGNVVYEGTAIASGDLNGDGAINVSDWTLFRSGSGVSFIGQTRIQSYKGGDLDGDFDNDFGDFRRFKQIYIAANGEAGFAALMSGQVPEPSAIVLAALALAGLALGRRQRVTAPVVFG